eukprot:3546076-Prymnesium_polylepis.1
MHAHVVARGAGFEHHRVAVPQLLVPCDLHPIGVRHPSVPVRHPSVPVRPRRPQLRPSRRAVLDAVERPLVGLALEDVGVDALQRDAHFEFRDHQLTRRMLEGLDEPVARRVVEVGEHPAAATARVLAPHGAVAVAEVDPLGRLAPREPRDLAADVAAALEAGDVR